MATSDENLGQRVHSMLLDANLETPLVKTLTANNLRMGHLESCFTGIMQTLGLDLTDDSLEKTPHRLAKMYLNEIFYGLDYANFPRAMAIENKMQVDEVVLVKDILVRSVCEHHFVPFIGSCHVAYIPKNKITGLSKLNRIVDFFCRRPQVQERLTAQIALTLKLILETDDIAVVINAEHYCVKLRGVQDPQSSTSTSKMLGRFMHNAALRAELFSLIGGSK